MPADEEAKRFMDGAADKAADALEKLEAEPELVPGIEAVAAWWSRNRHSARTTVGGPWDLPPKGAS